MCEGALASTTEKGRDRLRNRRRVGRVMPRVAFRHLEAARISVRAVEPMWRCIRATKNGVSRSRAGPGKVAMVDGTWTQADVHPWRILDRRNCRGVTAGGTMPFAATVGLPQESRPV